MTNIQDMNKVYRIAKANFLAAVDQQYSYDSLTEAFEVYIENAEYEASENGLDGIECSHMFEKLAIDAGYKSEVESMWTTN